MKSWKKIALTCLLAASFVFTGCSEESEVIIPDIETTSTTATEGTGTTVIDRDRD